MDRIQINAVDHFDPESDVTDSGTQLAHRVKETLAQSSDAIVLVSFKGIRGAASSFFNIFLHRVAGWSGPEVLTTRLSFDFGSLPQKLVFERSFQAVLAEVSNKP